MEAGRDLDTLVAEKVMGLEVTHSEISSPGYLHVRGTGSELPYYSTSISAAWQVVAKMKEDGHSITVNGWGEEFIEGEVVPEIWEVEFSGPEPRPFGKAGDAPHAICRAALKTKGIEL